MKSKRLRFLLLFFGAIFVTIAGLLFYFYLQGSVEHYVPPPVEKSSGKDQVLSDLSILSQAIEAYYAVNLRYPQNLEELQPDFLASVPVEPVTEKKYVYETDGALTYRIMVSNPGPYGFKELSIENGKIKQQ